MTYDEFVEEVTRLYKDETIDREGAVVVLATKHPTLYERHCREEED
jgi:hypothetical protein